MIACNKCNASKYDYDFYPRNKVCKECTKKRVSDYQKTDKGIKVHREANKRYSKTNLGREQQKRASEKYKNLPSTKKKELAKWAVKRAVKSGLLIRGKCEICESSVVHGHHCDYDRQLDVKWLCAKHHHDWHDKNGEGLNAN